MVSKIVTFFLLPLVLCLAKANAQEFTCETLDGESLTIKEWPIFIITTRSKDDLNETLRCASLVNSLENPHWLINFAWPGGEYAKRMAANALLKSKFMKSHSTILENSPPDSPLISLVDSEFQIIWCSSSYPVEADWNQAVKIFNSVREP